MCETSGSLATGPCPEYTVANGIWIILEPRDCLVMGKPCNLG